MKYSNFTLIAKSLFIVAMGLLCSISGQASAGPLTGEVMQLENLFQGSPEPGLTVQFTVDPVPNTIEVPVWGVPGFSALMNINVEDTGLNTATVTLTDINAGTGFFGQSPNLAFFSTVTASIPTFINVTLAAASTDWNDPSRVAFTGTTFSYDFGSEFIVPGDFIQLNITTAIATTTVPEPSSLLFFAFGFLVYYWQRRSRRAG